MGLVERELCRNGEHGVLLNTGDGAVSPESSWYALVVKHNHERAVAAGLEYKGLEYSCRFTGRAGAGRTA